MRTLVLSVYVGLLLGACGGSVDSAEEEVEGREAGPDRSDASDESATDASETPRQDDGGNRSDTDAGSTLGDGGARDAGNSTRDAGERDAAVDSGLRDAGARDAGNAGNDSGVDGGSGTPDAGGGNKGRPVFVIGGYRSGIAVSTDLGATWKTVHGPTGPFADNEYVLSGAAFGEGTFVVAGFDIFSSADGEHWTERTSSGSEWLGSMNYGNGVFVGAGGMGFSQWSDDGISWHKGTPSLGDEHSDTSAFGNGTFMATSRSGRWWRSTDGKSWTSDSTGHEDRIVWCQDHFSNEDDCDPLVANGQAAIGEGVWIRTQAGTDLRRSTNNGQTWSTVKVGFEATCVAFGYIQ
jgi:hypothetical protein